MRGSSRASLGVVIGGRRGYAPRTWGTRVIRASFFVEPVFVCVSCPERARATLIGPIRRPSPRMNLSHAPFRVVPVTSFSSAPVPPPPADPWVCGLCGRSLVGRRPETTSCSGRCRSALARQRRREDLVARVHRAETALREAAAALAHLKELAGLDATLELPPLRGRS